MTSGKHDSLLGCLLGTAVGDAIGLPSEGLPRRKVAARLGSSPLRHRFLFGRGMISDDTEHTLMVASALHANGRTDHPISANAFQRSLAWKLRWWFAAIPAGIGLSTAKAIIRLWCGFPVSRSGVRSAGNGAAMRSAIIGAWFYDESDRRREFALASCRITHTDARAEESALLVAEAAALACAQAPRVEVVDALRPLVTSPEMKACFAELEDSLESGCSVLDYAARIGCERGVSGFAPHSVAVALYAWLRHRGCFPDILENVIRCGGDTDSVAAIAGGICGSEVGESGIPQEWITGICDWPRSVSYTRKLAVTLSDPNPAASRPGLIWPALPFRNALFLVVVLIHGFYRLIPTRGSKSTRP